MSVNITIKNAVKRFGDKTIIPDLSVEINEGEFFTLLGPSGCGKTTLLRMIAGFNTIEGGTFKFNEAVINSLDPAKRNIGMVFQNYAIFPNLTVRKNVEYGLKARKIAKEEIGKRTDEMLALMQIEEYADRMPERLSGGQQQRVALARALVIEPNVLLMDEPLSNLDAKLRVEMRTVIKNIQHSIGITTVYVTHDQEEAMAVSDRIAVMNHGVIRQTDHPKQIYQRPADLFVASFIGKSNLIEADLRADGSLSFSDTYTEQVTDIAPDELRDRKTIVCVRPEDFIFSENEEGIAGVVADSVFLGLNTHYFVTLADGTTAEIIQESTIDDILPVGVAVKLKVEPLKINLFDPATELSIMAGVKTHLEGGAV